MTEFELQIVNVDLANRLYKAGFELIEQQREIDGNKCFVFAVPPGKLALMRKFISESK